MGLYFPRFFVLPPSPVELITDIGIIDYFLDLQPLIKINSYCSYQAHVILMKGVQMRCRERLTAWQTDLKSSLQEIQVN